MKTHNLTQISLRNDRINRRMHGFSFCIFEDEVEVQDVISPRSLDQILISSIPWTWKRVKNMKKIKWHSNWVSEQFEYLKNSRTKLPFAKNSVFKGEIRRNRPMKGRIAINDHDEASFD